MTPFGGTGLQDGPAPEQQGIPETCYEAAMIDGAGRFDLFRFITMPLLAGHAVRS